MTDPTSSHPRYRRDIDGLRAVAVLSVVAFHAFPKVVPGGYVGVDVFFVISGFLITTIILNGVRQGRFRFSDFYARRIRRIFPALAVVLAFCLGFGWFALLPGEYAQLGRHVAGGASFASNFVLWREAGYFDTTAEYKPLLHLWSLGIEEQFYIAWPLVIVVAWKARLRLLAVVSALLLGSFCLNIARVDEHVVSTFYMPMTRAWELLVGAVLAQLLSHGDRLAMAFGRRFSVPSATSRALAGVLLVIGAVFILDSRTAFPGWWALLPTVGAALLLSAGDQALVNRVLLGSRPMVFIGLISYPLYLWHWPLLSFVRIMESGEPSPWLRIAAVALGFFLAWLTYRFVERPVRAGAGPALTGGVVMAVVALGVTGYGLYRMEGMPQRVPDQMALLADFEWTDAQQNSRPCLQRMAIPGMRYCLMAEPEAQPTIALIGDSHANQYFHALAIHYGSRGENLVNLGGGGCVPFTELESSEKGTTTRCAEIMRDVLDYVVDLPSIHTVILASRGPFYTTGRGFGDIEKAHNRYIRDRLDPANENYPVVFANAMDRTLARLRAAGKKVVFVLDVPELGFDPRACVHLRPLTLTSVPLEPCAVPRNQFDARSRDYRELVLAVARRHPGMAIFDPVPSLCDESYCWARKDGVMLYRNDDHLSQKGAELVVRDWR